MHFLDLEHIATLQDGLIIELVPKGHGGYLGPGELGDGRKVQAIHDTPDDGDSQDNPGSPQQSGNHHAVLVHLGGDSSERIQLCSGSKPNTTERTTRQADGEGKRRQRLMELGWRDNDDDDVVVLVLVVVVDSVGGK